MKEETKQAPNPETFKKEILHNVFSFRNLNLSRQIETLGGNVSMLIGILSKKTTTKPNNQTKLKTSETPPKT